MERTLIDILNDVWANVYDYHKLPKDYEKLRNALEEYVKLKEIEKESGMNEKAKEVISNVKDILYVNVDSVYHRITKEQLGVLETTINNCEKKINDFDKYRESQKDLIKGKDEHIARLLNQNKELRDENKELVVRGAFNHPRILVTKDSISKEAIKQFKERFEQMTPITGSIDVEIEYNRYKAIELELGIDLTIFFKVLNCKNLFGHFDRFGQYNKSEIRKLRNIKLDLKKRRFLADDYGNVINIPLDFNKFGITWGLTKEELEDK